MEMRKEKTPRASASPQSRAPMISRKAAPDSARRFSALAALLSAVVVGIFLLLLQGLFKCSCASKEFRASGLQSQESQSAVDAADVPRHEFVATSSVRIVPPSPELLERAESSFQEHVELRRRLVNRTIPLRLKDLLRDDIVVPLPGRPKLEEVMFVPTYPCALEDRLGNWGQGKGGKWVCLAYNKAAVSRDTTNDVTPIVVSVRSAAKEASFELAAAEKLGARVELYDFQLPGSLQNELREKDKISVHVSMNVEGDNSSSSQDPATWLAANGMVQELEREGVARADVLHLDCAGCETEFLEVVQRRQGADVRYGQVVFRIGHTKDIRKTLLTLLRVEDMGYRMFHAEKDAFATGFLELSFIHHSLVVPEPNAEKSALRSVSPFPCSDPEAMEQLLLDAESAYLRQIGQRAPLVEGIPVPTVDDVKSSPQSHKDFVQDTTESLMMIPAYPCALERRLGIWGKGGKWTCLGFCNRDLVKIPAVVSIGSEGETSFEEAVFNELHTTPYTFDPFNHYLVPMLKQLKHLRFYDFGLTSPERLPEMQEKQPQNKWLTSSSLLHFLGLAYVDIFKIDCEGCEYDFVEDLLSNYNRDTAPFGEILMDLHFTWNVTAVFRIMLGLESLGYRLYHAEQNAWAPHCYELAYIHERLVKR